MKLFLITLTSIILGCSSVSAEDTITFPVKGGDYELTINIVFNSLDEKALAEKVKKIASAFGDACKVKMEIRMLEDLTGFAVVYDGSTTMTLEAPNTRILKTD